VTYPRDPLKAYPPTATFVIATLLASAGLLGAQSIKDQIGYTALIAELGGVPNPGATLNLIQREDVAWRYRKGTSEASVPTSDWRLTSFPEDGTWFTGQTSIGYSDGDDNTILGDMQNNYSCVFLRHTFTLTAGQIPNQLVLRVYVDDGALVWINGTEVQRINMNTGSPAFNTIPPTAVQEASWHEIRLTNAHTYLNVGTNILAVQAFNAPASSSDLSIDCELFMPSVTQVESSDDRAVTGGDPIIAKYLPLSSPDSSPAFGDIFTEVGGAYDGTTVEVNSILGGISYNQSLHARNVASRMIHNSLSMAPNIARVRGYQSSAWLGSSFLHWSSSSQPAEFEYSITQNHSWIGTDSEDDRTTYNRALRRFDYSIAQNDYLPIVGLNNWLDTNDPAPAVPPLLATSYHSVAVGLTNGLHSQGGTQSFYDGQGRIKPDVVAPDYATSYATATTSSTTALLYEIANFDPLLEDAMNVEAMKAILMAGATKEEFPSWSHTQTQPLDSVFGAGEVNVQNSYHILKGGKQNTGTVSPVALRGWNFSSIPGSSTQSYLIRVSDHSKMTKLSALLTWHRQYTATPWTNDFQTQPSLPNLNMRLYTSNGGSPETLIDASVSTIDNLEHIYQLELAPGDYLLQVESDTTVDYGIAWRSKVLIEKPEFSVEINGDDIDLASSTLVDGVSYTVQRSTDLVGWTDIGTLVGGVSSAISDINGALLDRVFYRLKYPPEL